MSTTYPAHASPRPDYQTQPGRTISEYNLLQDGGASGASTPSAPQPIAQPRASKQPPPLVSPSYTPPTTPNGSLDPSRTITSTDIHSTHLSESPTDEELASLQSHPASPPPTLTPLPEVTCEVRARIPTTTGQEMFLHLYHNSADNKEHLAIVFGPYIRSKSLDAPIPGETEKDRMIRGAYVGTLFPGRTSSRIEALKREAGVASPPSPSLSPSLSSSSSSASLQQQGLGVTLPMSPVQAPQRMEGDDAVIGGSETRTDEKQGQGEETAPSAPVDPTQEPPFVRIHSECYTGETVWSARCDCGEQLDEAARIMSLSPFGGMYLSTAPLQPLTFSPKIILLTHLFQKLITIPTTRRNNLPQTRRPRHRPPQQTKSLQPARSRP